MKKFISLVLTLALCLSLFAACGGQPADFALSAWIQACDADHRVPYLQSLHFAEELAPVLCEENVSFGIIEGADHEDSAFYTEENLTAVWDWLDTVLK